MVSTKNKGLTLVEIMIGFLLFSLVLGLGYLFFNRTFKSLDRQRQSLDTLHEARQFLALIERDLREMTRLVSLDTVFKDNFFHEDNGLFHSMVIEVPNTAGTEMQTITYSYEGPDFYRDVPNRQKTIYRQVKGQTKIPIITRQLKFLKIFGTDGTIFRNRQPGETLESWRQYLTPHYYHPTNPATNGLRDLGKVKGVEIQLVMNEILDSKGVPIKTRTFATRIYSRVLNAKYQQ